MFLSTKVKIGKNIPQPLSTRDFLIGYLTLEEYFYFVGELRGLNESQVDSWLEEFEVFFNGEVLGQKNTFETFPKETKKKVGLVAAFLGNPNV